MSDPATTADIAALKAEMHGVHNDIVYWGSAIAKKLDALAAAPSGGAAALTGTGSSSSDASAAKYFPANVGDAAFPSPENSSILRLGGTISGKPYLRDKTGAVHQLVPVTADIPNGYTVNGAHADGGGYQGDAGGVMNLLSARQGGVFAQRASGQWQQFNPAMGGLYNASLPDAFVTDASGATTSTVAPSSVKAPTLPVRQSPAPGASGRSLTVGSGKTFSTLTDAIKAAAAGDTIKVDPGTYKEAPPAWTVPLFIDCDGVALIDCTGLTGSLARGKGALVPCADSRIRNIHVTGVAMDQTTAQLTSGVRPDGGCGYLLLENVELFRNQSGLGTGGDLVIDVTVSGGHFYNNGLNGGDDRSRGYTHNIYTGAGTSLTLKGGFASTAPNGGHAVKHRGWAFVCTTPGPFDANEAAVFDIPNGSVGQAIIDGAQITKPAGSYNHAVIDYATDDTSSGNGGLLIKNSNLALLCDSPFFNVGSGSVITLDASTKLTGTRATSNGGKVVGL